jgi:hypothetical protein
VAILPLTPSPPVLAGRGAALQFSLSSTLAFRFRSTFLGFSVPGTLVVVFVEGSSFCLEDWEVFSLCIGEVLFGLRMFELESIVARIRRGL